MASSDTPPLTDLAFSNSVKAMQNLLGSREQMARLETAGRWRQEIDDNLAAFISGRKSFYFGTSSTDGRPYIQHRGGDAGFITMPDSTHLEFADYKGNRQYISLGNLDENPKAFIFMMDYLNKTRIKFWGKAALKYTATGARFIRFTIQAWDVNCKQYIPDLVDGDSVREALIELKERNRALEKELELLRASQVPPSGI